MNTPARIILWLLVVAGAAVAIWIVGIRPSGPTIQDDAEKERAAQRGHNAEICRLARNRLGRTDASRKGAETEIEQDEEVVRVKCKPLGL